MDDRLIYIDERLDALYGVCDEDENLYLEEQELANERAKIVDEIYSSDKFVGKYFKINDGRLVIVFHVTSYNDGFLYGERISYRTNAIDVPATVWKNNSEVAVGFEDRWDECSEKEFFEAIKQAEKEK